MINHDFKINRFLPIGIRSIRRICPEFWIGVNFLAVTGQTAFPILASLQREGYRVDAYWADDACIDERVEKQVEANLISKIRKDCEWQGLYFGGTAFKKQRPIAPKNFGISAEIAAKYMDVVTTSGVATGTAADVGKLEVFRSALPNTPLALASGINPDNILNYSMVDCFMVATGINKTDDFYNIDPSKLRLLMSRCKEIGDQI